MAKDGIEDFVPAGAGPNETPPTQPVEEPKPTLKKITVSGVEIEVPEEVANLVEGREKEFSRKLSVNSEELGQLRKSDEDRRALELERETKPKEDYSDLIFEDQAEYNRMLKKDVIGEVEKMINSAKSEFTQAQHHDSFWQTFYTKNKDLSKDKHHYLIEAILMRNQVQWKDVPVAEAQVKLAEEARKAFGLSKKPPTQTKVVDGGGGIYVEPPASSNPSMPGGTQVTQPNSGSMSSFIKKIKDKKGNY